MHTCPLRLGVVGLLALAAPVGVLASPTVSSNADQYLFVGDPPTPISVVTVTDDATAPVITAANDLRIRIPAGFPMTWHPGDLSAVVIGSAAAKVSTTVTLEDADATLVLDVIADFAASDQILVSGLSFASFAAASGFDNLELEVGNDDVVTALDGKTIKVVAPVSTRSSAIKVTPDGSEVWVVNPDHGSVAVLSTATNTLLAEVAVGANPWTVELHPWNGEAWVASMDDDRIDVVDVASRTVIDSIDLGYQTFGVAFNPQGTLALVTATGSDQVFAVDVATRSPIATLAVYRRPRGIVWRDDGGRAWVSHLLMPEFIGRLTRVFPSTWTKDEIFINQVFNQNLGGYPSTIQNIAIAPAPGDTLLWLPNNMIHTSNGQLFGNPLTATNMFHACIRPINLNSSTAPDMVANTYYLSESGTDVGGPIAVDFKNGRAYVANLHSDNVTVLTSNILTASELAVVPAGSAPIGVVAHPTLNRVYVANWLGRSVTVINTTNQTVVTTVPTTSTEVLGSQILNGKRLFFTSTGNMSVNQRASCASCHVFGAHDGRDWDLSQFGKHIRATPDIRGIGFTGAHDWTGDKDELADHNQGIIEFAGGPGLIPGGGNPALGAPNAGLSQDMDDIGRWMVSLTYRSDTPSWVGGAPTAAADSGRTLFHDPTVGCATCHSGPFFTDSRLQQPFIKHDVGTADPGDADAAAGFDTPSLVGAWDTGPYLHHADALTLQQVMTTYNPSDQHGTTSQLSAAQIDFIAEYVKSIGWPDSTGAPVSAAEVAASGTGSLGNPFPNPFARETSLSFSLERNDSRVEIEVFDVRGRLVRTLLDRRLTRGRHIVGWDSRDTSGALVAPGVYFARYRVNGEPGGEKKMVVLR
jgi:YVTN family beta-propeller protein